MSEAIISYPAKDGVMLTHFIDEQLDHFPSRPLRVLVIFWHGLGDLVMFLPVFHALQMRYVQDGNDDFREPTVVFDLGLAKGLGQEEVYPNAVMLDGDQVNNDAITKQLPYDIVCKLDFPMNEHQQQFTKGEWCCMHELGMEPVAGHGVLPTSPTRLVAVHFQITCLPGAANPDEQVAQNIWNDVLAAGFVPLEVHFEHVFHNPENKRFPFVGASIRGAQPRISSLVGIMQRCAAFVGVVSGPFHVAMSCLPDRRILLLEKDLKLGSFTKRPIATADVRNYQGEVKRFLDGLAADEAWP